MLDEQHGFAGRDQATDEGQGFVDAGGVEIGQGFVEQKHFGFHDQSAGHGHLLLFATAEGIGLPVPQVGDVQGLEHRVDAAAHFGAGHGQVL